MKSCIIFVLSFYSVWDLESSVNMNKKDDAAITANANTWNTLKSEVSANSASSIGLEFLIVDKGSQSELPSFHLT